MSVNPGFGGQSFIPSALEKIRALRRMIDERGSTSSIEVDGGIKVDNIAEVAAAGAERDRLGLGRVRHEGLRGDDRRAAQARRSRALTAAERRRFASACRTGAISCGSTCAWQRDLVDVFLAPRRSRASRTKHRVSLGQGDHSGDGQTAIRAQSRTTSEFVPHARIVACSLDAEARDAVGPPQLREVLLAPRRRAACRLRRVVALLDRLAAAITGTVNVVYRSRGAGGGGGRCAAGTSSRGWIIEEVRARRRSRQREQHQRDHEPTARELGAAAAAGARALVRVAHADALDCLTPSWPSPRPPSCRPRSGCRRDGSHAFVAGSTAPCSRAASSARPQRRVERLRHIAIADAYRIRRASFLSARATMPSSAP